MHLNLDLYRGTTFKSMRRTPDEFETLSDSALGQGSYGKVVLVKDKSDGTIYAMKIIDKKFQKNEVFVNNLKLEIRIHKCSINQPTHKHLRHPHIVRMRFFMEDLKAVYLVMEHVENGSLAEYLKLKKVLSEEESFVYFFQVCCALEYLHQKDIIHRDLKPENLLLDSAGNIKVCDFGWAALNENDKDRNTFCGTLDYMAPEVMKGQNYSKCVDMWALGVLLYEMSTPQNISCAEMVHGYSVYGTNVNIREKLFLTKRGDEIKYGDHISSDLKSLLQGLLKSEPSERLTSKQVFFEKWMETNATKNGIVMEEYIRQNQNFVEAEMVIV